MPDRMGGVEDYEGEAGRIGIYALFFVVWAIDSLIFL